MHSGRETKIIGFYKSYLLRFLFITGNRAPKLTQLYAHGRGAGSKTHNNSRFSNIRVVYDKKQPDDPHLFQVGHCKYKNRIPYRFLVLGSMRYYLQGLLAIPMVILDCELTSLVYP